MVKKSLPKDSYWWSANIYLAGEIAKCADQLIKHQKSYPGVFDRKNDKSKIIKYSKANERKWHNILVDIRDGFRLYAKCDGDFYEWKGGKRGTFKHKKLPDGNWEVIQTNDAKLIINKKKLDKFKRAMGLFAKYYDHLWD
jgi:hypothetical protein